MQLIARDSGYISIVACVFYVCSVVFPAIAGSAAGSTNAESKRELREVSDSQSVVRRRLTRDTQVWGVGVPTTEGANGEADASCGAQSLFVCVHSLGRTDVSLKRVEDLLSSGRRGVSLADLAGAATRLGVDANTVRGRLQTLIKIGSPSILHVRPKHFVALLASEGERLLIFDSRNGLLRCDIVTFEAKYNFSGAALILTQAPTLVFLPLGSLWLTVSLCVLLAALLAQVLREKSPNWGGHVFENGISRARHTTNRKVEETTMWQRPFDANAVRLVLSNRVYSGTQGAAERNPIDLAK